MPESSPAQIAIVEDDATLREALLTLMTTEQYDCRMFASAEDYLESNPLSAFCCLVLDIHLPSVGGLNLQQQLANVQQPAVPILFISGDATLRDAMFAIKAGAADFLQKPLDTNVLLERIARAVRASRLGRNQYQDSAYGLARLRELDDDEEAVQHLHAEGYSSIEIARRLNHDTRTVKAKQRAIERKLDVRTLGDLAFLLLRSGRVIPPR